MAKNVKSLQTKKASCLEREFLFHHVEGFIWEEWMLISPHRHLDALSKHWTGVILTGIYMHTRGVVCHSATGYGSPLSFGAGSVLPISRFRSTHCHRILTYKCLAVLGHTVYVKPPPLSALLVTSELCGSVCTCISSGTRRQNWTD